MADVTVLYFVSSGEVFKISQARAGKPAKDFRGSFDPDFVGQLDDPVFTDVSLPYSLPRNAAGKLVAGSGSLIADPGTNAVRPATETEYAQFDAARLQMEHAAEAKEAERRILQSPRYRKVFKALVKRILQLHNMNASQINGIKQAIANASTLAQIKTAVGALPALPDSITLVQALNALKSDISPDD